MQGKRQEEDGLVVGFGMVDVAEDRERVDLDGGCFVGLG